MIDSFNNVLKQDAASESEPVFDNDLSKATVHINLNTLQSALKIFDIALYLALRNELIARKICIMRAVTVVVVEGMHHLLVDSLFLRV